MGRRIDKNKKKKICRWLKVISIISTIMAILFCLSLFVLDMLPLKYLIIIYAFLFILYYILLFLIFKFKIKLKIKVVCIIFMIIFDIVFGFGIKYVFDTISFVDLIDNALHQKEEYYVMSLSNYDKINALEDKKIGIYITINSNKATKELSDKISFTSVEFNDVLEMFDKLEEKEVDAILINSSIKNLIETEYEELDNNLKEIYSFSVTISKHDDIVKVVDVTKKPFNVYVAGGDAYGDIGNVTNTDVNMVISVDPVNKKILLTSIPRDYYVNLSGMGEDAYDKITHAGYYGIGESVSAVENLLDTEINYYVKVNFSTIVEVIDAIGGVDVYVEKGFTTSNKKYTFKTGDNHLNGEEALRFARERKVFANGDVQRVKNQQKVLEAIINKVTKSSAIITNFSEILDSVSGSLSTNMDTKSMNSFVKMQLNDMASWKIEKQNLIGTDYYTTETFTFPGTNLYVMKRDEDSVNKATSKIKEFISGD